jgi:hypothetical protein
MDYDREIKMRHALGVILLLAVSSAQAAVIITATESDGNVIFQTESGGSLNLSGLTQTAGFNSAKAWVNPGAAILSLGPGGLIQYDNYEGVISPGPLGPLGPENYTIGSIGTGDRFGVIAPNSLLVPVGYVSSEPLFATSTYENETLASLGFSQGVYVWSLPNDTITLNVVPIPASVWLFGSALAGLGWMRRKQTA